MVDPPHHSFECAVSDSDPRANCPDAALSLIQITAQGLV
jgi:hypothetical protein